MVPSTVSVPKSVIMPGKSQTFVRDMLRTVLMWFCHTLLGCGQVRRHGAVNGGDVLSYSPGDHG